MELHGAGLDREALELLTDLGAFIAPDDVEPGQWPWFHNVKGMALSGLRQFEEADQAYRRMQQLAEALPKGPVRDDLLSTALQNRGSSLSTLTNRPPPFRSCARPYLQSSSSRITYRDDVFTSLALIAEGTDEVERMLQSKVVVLSDSEFAAAFGTACFGTRGTTSKRVRFRKAQRYSRAEATHFESF